MKNIAFLGIGAMGERIASNLIDAGYQLHIWNRTAEKCQTLVNKGAVVYQSPQEAVQNARIAIAMLTDDEVSRQVWLNPNTGAIYGLKPHTIVMEFSTLTPSWCCELEIEVNRRHCEFLDAPVVGSRPQAEAKQLIYLVGGEIDTLKRVTKILQANSKAIHHTGDVGTAMKIKLAINVLFAVQVSALSEMLGILTKTGISLDSALDLLELMPITSPALKGIGTLLKNRNYAPLFPIDLVTKDLSYAEQLRKSVGASAIALSTVQEIYQQAQKAGYGEDNITGVARLFL